MEDPRAEVSAVVTALIEAPNAAAQRDTLQSFFTPDASFDHPLCAVRASPNSRDSGLLPIYQWLKIMFDSSIVVNSVGFDEHRGDRLYVDASQTLKPRVWPLSSIYAPVARLVVVLHLTQAPDGKYYIKRQEDLYQWQELPGKVNPLLPWAIDTVKLVAGFNCAMLAKVFQLLGIWAVREGGAQAKAPKCR
ncbi:hypothetical protein K437DRAFT_258245 [Tilletiaria anomala UBC 951]|uniref:SigF-like NTF2-like domain-containing protein n=1 Tax=Tilletiaria anomala (strain ATCC 24038 / CBS 436.72 / UBC 951) TaxID=1037660 RepID=A0A066VJ69_TILAU|nr:uncharacterized protein K437DRAFT_258245 [Tilletiaria anomala UBC 951]KDN41536.1 hypothetical protein K437DRAFT_258245 [Tilletiaria anomala UBC 951]